MNVLTYFNNKHDELKDDYIAVDGASAVCGNIALKIAQLLISHGEKPELLSITPDCDGQLVPKVYAWQDFGWDKHFVCSSSNLVYDPLLSQPVFLEDYKQNVFTKPVIVEVHANYTNLIEEFLPELEK